MQTALALTRCMPGDSGAHVEADTGSSTDKKVAVTTAEGTCREGDSESGINQLAWDSSEVEGVGAGVYRVTVTAGEMNDSRASS